MQGQVELWQARSYVNKKTHCCLQDAPKAKRGKMEAAAAAMPTAKPAKAPTKPDKQRAAAGRAAVAAGDGAAPGEGTPGKRRLATAADNPDKRCAALDATPVAADAATGRATSEGTPGKRRKAAAATAPGPSGSAEEACASLDAREAEGDSPEANGGRFAIALLHERAEAAKQACELRDTYPLALF